MIQFRPSPEDLHRLKIPMGTLLRGDPSQTMPLLRRLVQEAAPPRVITVGDVVSKETLASAIKVRLRIVDYKTMRNLVDSPKFPGKTYRVKNPAGVITKESWDAIKHAVASDGEAVILVEGEEDLLTIPCIIEAPDDSFVVYGQPSEGLVVVTATSQKKKEAANMMERMTQEKAPF